MKILESATTNCVSEVVEHDGPGLLFVRGKFGRCALLTIECSDDPECEFLEVASATRSGVIPINFHGRYFVRVTLSGNDEQFGFSDLTVSTNQQAEVVA